MRMRLSSALDENERLDSELVGQLVRQARVKSAATSPLKSQNTIEVRGSINSRKRFTMFTFCEHWLLNNKGKEVERNPSVAGLLNRYN